MGARRSWQLRAYLAFSRLSGPLWRLALRSRQRRGKEDPARLPERLGRASMERPQGPLIWFHALSVGESLALLALIERILDERTQVSVLLTTATRTSAEALGRQNLPDRVIHQMLPVDVHSPVTAFLDHWRPDLAVFSELDFWPAIMAEAHARAIPMALINSRVSAKNFEKRKSGAALFQDILGMFEVALVQDDATRQRFIALGCTEQKISVLGALKGAPRPLPAEETTLNKLQSMLGDRSVWLAASTEAREHHTVIEAHKRIMAQRASAVLILAPRNPNEAETIVGALKTAGMTYARWSKGDAISPETNVLLADTIGEMGLWYRLAPVTFMGHSLTTENPVLRGKNPFEAAVFDTALVHGPNTIDFEETYSALDVAGAAIKLDSNDALASAVLSLWEPETAATQTKAAQAVLARTARVLDETLAALDPLILRN